MMYTSSAALLALLLAAAEPPAPKPAWLEGKERDEFLSQVERAMAGAKSIAATFQQEKELPLFQDTVRTSGFLLFERPDRLRWETRKPFRSVLIVAGNEVGKFEWIGGERRSLRLGRGADVILAVMDRIRGWFQGKFDREGKEYEVDAARSPKPRIVLRPKDRAIGRSLRAVELDLAPDLSSVHTVTIVEEGGGRTVMRFEERKRGGEFPPGTFSPTDPADVDIDRIAGPERAPAEGKRA